MSQDPRAPFDINVDAPPRPRPPGHDPAVDHHDPPDSPNRSAAVPTQPDPRPPKQDPAYIGPFRVLQRVGEGGMGIVYKCEQRDPVRRVVAVKVIKVGMDTRDVVARFNAERQALSLMNHPNVARALDAGATDSGRPYFAMEYVAGVPITRYCDDYRLTTRQRLDLFVPVCLAVQHAHHKGIIHRDLKPTNILVTLADGQPVPKVIDFGIAKAANLTLTQQTLFTQIGSMIGTPEYMSPEQAQTSGMDVDTRTDIYSLGVILYELLSGTLPFDPEQFKKMGIDGIARVIRESEPRRPSTRLARLAAPPAPAPHSPAEGNGDAAAPPTSTPADRRRTDTRSLVRELRGDLDWIIMKAMDKDRGRRYETAYGLALDVRRYLDHEAVIARPPTTCYRLTRFARRHQGAVAAAAVVTLSLLAGITATSIATVRARAAEQLALQQKEDVARALAETARAQAKAEREALKARTVSQFLQDVLAPPERDGDELVRDMKVVDLLKKAADDVDTRFATQPDVRLQTRYTLFRTYSNLGLAELANIQLRLAADVLNKNADLRETETALRVAADNAYYFSGNPADREALAAKAEQVARERLGETSEPAILADNVRAVALAAQGKADQADAIQRHLIDLLRARGTDSVEDANIAAPFANLGDRLRAQGKFADAEGLFRDGLAFANAARYNRLRMRWILSSRRAAALEDQAKFEEAAIIHKGIIADVRQKLGEDHPAIGPSIENYVAVLRRLARPQDIANLEREQREIFQRASDQPATTPMLLARRAHARVCAGHFAEAVEDYASLINTEHGQHKHRYYQACLLAYLNDRPRYDQVRDQMLKAFAAATEYDVNIRLSKAALLLPASPDQRRAAANMLRRCAGEPNNVWFRLAAVLLDYRDGNYADAIQKCNALGDHALPNPAANASVLHLLALAHHAQGAHTLATTAARKADDLIAEKVPPLESGRIYGVSIEDWLICNVLQREVKDTLR